MTITLRTPTELMAASDSVPLLRYQPASDTTCQWTLIDTPRASILAGLTEAVSGLLILVSGWAIVRRLPI